MSKNFSRGRRRFLAASSLVIGSIGAYFGFRAFRKPPRIELGAVPGSLAALDDSTPYDVCIVGSGPAATTLGTALARDGVRTLMIESGVDLMAPKPDPRRIELEVFESSGRIDYPVAATRVRAIGGTSTVWTGRCSRMHPLDFEVNPYTPAGAAWPIRYADLEPYYARAEKALGVRGGALSKFHAPRSGPLPLPADLDISGLRQLMQGIGVTVDDSPTSSGRGGETPFRVARDLMPEFVASPNATLLTGATLTRLLADADGHITGAEVQNLDRVKRTARARLFVIACGGLETPRLLLMSRDERFPNGIGNHHDRVGRGFIEHPNLNFTGHIEHNWTTVSPNYEIGRSHQFYDAFKREGVGSVLLVFTQSWVYRDDLEKWDIEALRKKASAVFSRLRHAEFRIGATMEMLPIDDNRVTLSTTRKDYFGHPASNLALSYSDIDRRTQERTRDLIQKLYADLGATDVKELGLTWSCHHMGSCRMGDNPRASVVDANLRVHGSDNLYIAGSATFVTSGAAHPTPGIVALSYRLADHIRDRIAAG